MVGENTKQGSLDLGGSVEGEMVLDEGDLVEGASDELAAGGALRSRSPLLPARHQRDFFVCDLFDAAVKGDSASMEHPIFSLSKKPDMKIRRYENGEKWVEIRPSVKGLATVFDRDVLIYCISQLMAGLNSGRPISRVLRLRAHDLLVATNRDTSGRGYVHLRDAMERLQGTQIATNIVTGGQEIFDVFGLINRARIVRETREGRMQDIEIELSDWVFRAVEAKEVLTLDRRYFQLAKPMERRLYELARKHLGNQSGMFRISIDKLHEKCGSQSTSKEFRRLLGSILAADAEHQHMPGYAFKLVDDMVHITHRHEPRTTIDSDDFPIPPDAFETARALAPGWDVYGLAEEWRAWIAKRGIFPRNAARHFQAFCKRRGSHPSWQGAS